MKRIIIFLTCCASGLLCFAKQAVYNGLNYSIDAIARTAEVAEYNTIGGQLLIPDEITVGQETYRVTGIAENAFKGCKNLTAVTFPEGLEYLSRNAFEGTGIWLNKENWQNGVLFIDSCLIATDKTINPKYVVPESTRLIAAGAFQGNKTLTRIELPTTLTRIDNDLFRDCKNLSKVVIPASVTWIGQDVFVGSGIWLNEKKWKKGALYIDGCLIAVNKAAPAKFVFKDKVPTRLLAAGAFSNAKQLKSITLPEGIHTIPVTCFYKCATLTEVVIPESVTSVERMAFAECEQLAVATLPQHLETLGIGAFYMCRNLKQQTLSDQLKGIPTACFLRCSSFNSITLPQNLEIIGDGAFAGCSNLEEPTLPKSLKSIGEKAFANCDRFRKVIIPDNVTFINKAAYSDCPHLNEVVLPEGLYALEDETFRNCISLERVKLPKTLYRIGKNAFTNCQELYAILLPDNLHRIEDEAFMECKKLYEIQLPVNLSTLGSGAFAMCVNLTNVRTVDEATHKTCPLTSIDAGTFYQCRQLKEFVIPDSVKIIDEDSFNGCKNLRQVSFPPHLKKVGANAFRDCTSLTAPMLSKDIEVGKNAFKGCK